MGAPEVIAHRPYGLPCDVHSYGVLLWELHVGGSVPYSGHSPLQAAVAVVQQGLRPAMPQGAHPRLATLMRACWAADPEARPMFAKVVEALAKVAREVHADGTGAAPSNSYTAVLAPGPGTNDAWLLSL